MKLTFLGAAGTVTGSQTLWEHDGRRVLVDCGLHQGLDEEGDVDRAPPPYAPSSLDAIVLTHAHLDHSGLLPRLVKLGFDGTVYCTAGTRDLCGVILPDSGYLQEEHAARVKRREGRVIEPLYTLEHAEEALHHLRGVPYGEPVPICAGVSATFRPAGHITGASAVELRSGTACSVHSGDVGRPGLPVGGGPDPLPATQVLVVESTYGDRLHPDTDSDTFLADLVTRTAARGGVVLMPAFAVGRTLMLLVMLHRLRKAGRIPWVPVWMDSPMARRAVEVATRHAAELLIDPSELGEVLQGVRVAITPEESARLDEDPEPMVLVSASGMVEGGRVLHHVRRLGTSRRHTILLVGYQAEGTRGAALADGERYLEIHGETVHVRAQVEQLSTLSAHADQGQLLDWLATMPSAPERVLVNHGVPSASATLAAKITARFGWPAHAVAHGEVVDCDVPPAAG